MNKCSFSRYNRSCVLNPNGGSERGRGMAAVFVSRRTALSSHNKGTTPGRPKKGSIFSLPAADITNTREERYFESIAITACRMGVEMQTTTRCWVGTAGTGYPRFEAWDSTGATESHWYLRVIRNTGAEPIEVSGLHSLDEARQLASGMLTGLGGSKNRRLNLFSSTVVLRRLLARRRRYA